MSIRRHGLNEAKGSGPQALPFAKATEADGLLYVSGQTPMVDGEVIDGGIVPQAHQAIRNMIVIVEDAGCSTAEIMRIGVSGLPIPGIFGALTRCLRNTLAKTHRHGPVFSRRWLSTAKLKWTASPFVK